MHAKLISDHHDRFGDVTRYRVRKCVRELGIRGICPNASKQTTKQAKDAEERPDLIKRDLASPVPTHRLAGDITHVKTACGLTCLAIAVDLCTRMVVGWSIRDNMRAELVVSAMDMAWERGYIAINAIFHSDYAEENAIPQKRRFRNSTDGYAA